MMEEDSKRTATKAPELQQCCWLFVTVEKYICIFVNINVSE